MSTQILPLEMLAQTARTLESIASNVNNPHLPKGLRDAVLELKQSNPLYAGLGERDMLDRDYLFSIVSGLYEDNLGYFAKNHPSKVETLALTRVSNQAIYDAIKNTTSLISPALLQGNAQDDPLGSEKLAYFAKSLGWVNYNTAQPRSTIAILALTREADLASLVFSANYADTKLFVDRIATDIMELTANGASIVHDSPSNFMSEALEPLDAFYSQGTTSRRNVDVPGRDVFVDLLSQMQDGEIYLPLSNTHTDTPKTIKNCKALMTYPVSLQGDYKKPTAESITRVGKALIESHAILTGDEAPLLLKLNGTPLSESQIHDFNQSLKNSAAAFASLTQSLRIPFSVGVTYEQTRDTYIKSRENRETLYLLSEKIDVLPGVESLDDLKKRIDFIAPEFSFTLSKTITAGVNQKDIHLHIAEQGEPLSPAVRNDAKKRLATVMKEVVHHAYVHDSGISVSVTQPTSPLSALTALPQVFIELSEKPGDTPFQKVTLPNGETGLYKQATNALSNPNGQDGKPLPVKPVSTERLRTLVNEKDVMLFRDLKTAQAVMKNTLEHNPFMARTLVLAQAPISEHDLLKLSRNTTIQTNYQVSIRSLAVKSAVAQLADSWDEMTEYGRSRSFVHHVMEECLKRGATEPSIAILEQAVHQVSKANPPIDSPREVIRAINYSVDVIVTQANALQQKEMKVKAEPETPTQDATRPKI